MTQDDYGPGHDRRGLRLPRTSVYEHVSKGNSTLWIALAKLRAGYMVIFLVRFCRGFCLATERRLAQKVYWGEESFSGCAADIICCVAHIDLCSSTLGARLRVLCKLLTSMWQPMTEWKAGTAL